jgi:hypothetical protein
LTFLGTKLTLSKAIEGSAFTDVPVNHAGRTQAARLMMIYLCTGRQTPEES